MTPTQKAAMQAALEAFQTTNIARHVDAIVALRAALAEPAVEPVVTLCVKREESKLALQYKGEEVALDLPDGEYKLYTSPPPPAEVPLLSDFEISDIFQRSNKPGSSHGDFARAIEKAVRQKAGLK